jgi:hypothetical protein
VRDVSVRRWRRYGRDRLYVTDPGGRTLGWHDPATGATHVAVADAAPEVAAAVSGWQAASGTGGARVAEPEPRPDPVPAPPRRDLVENQPGELARARAVSLGRAAPVRTFAERLLGLRTDERAWRIGAAGEVRVAGDLEQLRRHDARWRVLHAVPVGDRGSDIDHVVFGPGGVFTLNAKNHPGATVWLGGDTLMVNGDRRLYVRNSASRRGGRLVSSALPYVGPSR